MNVKFKIVQKHYRDILSYLFSITPLDPLHIIIYPDTFVIDYAQRC